MKKIAVLLLTLMLLTSCTVSKRVTSLQVPTFSASQDEVDIAAYEEKYGEYDGVYLESEYILEHTGIPAYSLAISPWKFYEISKFKYIVFNPDATSVSTFSIQRNTSAKLEKFYIRVIYPNGEIEQFGSHDLYWDQTTNHQKTYKFAYPNITKGTIIDVGYELSYLIPYVIPPTEHVINLQYPMPCEKLKFKYAFPDWWEIQAKKIAENVSLDVEMAKDPENNKKTITYAAENIPAYKMEAYAPVFKEIGKYYQFQITKMSMNGMNYNAPKSWREAARGFKTYATRKDGLFSSEVLDTTNGLIKGQEDPLEKMDAIITYLQENIKIANDGKKRNFKEILIDKQGDAYRITGLAQSMLMKAGLDAKYLLLHSSIDGYLDKDYIRAGQFSHPAIGIKLEGHTYVLFPYLKAPIGYVPEFFLGQQAIAITLGEGHDYTIDFWDVPVETITRNKIDGTCSLAINEEGVIHAEEDMVFSGSLAIALRERLKELKKDEQEGVIQELLDYDESSIEFSSFELENIEAYKAPLRIRLTYDIDNLVTVLPDEVIFQTAGLFSPSSGSRYKIDTEERYNPIKILFDAEFNKQISIRFPESWVPATALNDVKTENIFGSIEGTYQVEPGQISASHKLNLKRSYESREKITALKEIAGAQSMLFIPSIIFTHKQTQRM